MIACYLKGYTENNVFFVGIPSELSHYFIGVLKEIYNNGKIKEITYKLPNHYIGDLEISVSDLDNLEKDYQFLYDNLDKVIKIAPLPKKIGISDGYYYNGFIEIIKSKDGEIYGEKNFTKEDMFLLINLIKIKILEAKSKNISLIFSGD